MFCIFILQKVINNYARKTNTNKVYYLLLTLWCIKLGYVSLYHFEVFYKFVLMKGIILSVEDQLPDWKNCSNTIVLISKKVTYDF